MDKHPAGLRKPRVRLHACRGDHTGAHSRSLDAFVAQDARDGFPRERDGGIAARALAFVSAATQLTCVGEPLKAGYCIFLPGNAHGSQRSIPRSTPQTSVGKQGSNPRPLLIARLKHIPAHNFNSFPPNNLSAEGFMSSDPNSGPIGLVPLLGG
jgi:hypothetical protein